MNHYFLIPSVSSQKPNGDKPPLENFDKDFPHKFRAELYQFYNNSLGTKNRDPYRFLGCRGIKQKFWLNEWNNYLKNKTLPALDRFESNLFEMLRKVFKSRHMDSMSIPAESLQQRRRTNTKLHNK